MEDNEQNFLIKWKMGDFQNSPKNAVIHRNLTDYTSLSEKTTILTPAIFLLTHRGPVDLRKWTIFNTILMSPKSWLYRPTEENLDAGCEHSLVPMDS